MIGGTMTAYNVVRFRTKPGKERAFVEAHEKAAFKAAGFRKGALVDTGNRTFCMIGEWDSMDALAAARPTMIGILNSFRDLLEDLGGNLGVTDPVSGTVAAELKG
jgi:quinol monooxygenase YgiN